MTQSTVLARRPWVFAGAALLIAIFWLQLALSVHRNSFTWDEDDHIYSGYMSWKHADFGLNPEHPPLVKLVAALPLLHLPIKMPALQNRFFKLEGFLGGKEFFFNNDADAMLFRARLAVSFFAVLLAALVFLAAKEMFGPWAGFIALALLAFDPNFLAHGAVVGTDIGLSCFLFASIYAFYRYVKAPSAWRLILAGLATGLAISSKHTAVLVFPMLAMLAVCELFLRENTSASTGRQPKGKCALRLAGALVLITVISVGVLWAFYGFRYAARPAGLTLNPPLSDFVKGLHHPIRDQDHLAVRALPLAARVLPVRPYRRPPGCRLHVHWPARQGVPAWPVVLLPDRVPYQDAAAADVLLLMAVTLIAAPPPGWCPRDSGS